VSEQQMPEHTGSTEVVEILRAWVQEDTLYCSLAVGAVADAPTWGTVLADLARHVAEAIQEEEGTDPAEALRQIRAAFAEELDTPHAHDSSEGAG
jgi:hypothetical protein